MAVQIDRKRKTEPVDVEVLTPHGGTVTVTQSRADTLMARPPIPGGDGIYRKYVLAESGESIEVAPAVTAARAPRRNAAGEGSN